MPRQLSGEHVAQANTIESLNDQIRQHRDLIVAHDHVHPDRNTCGGVGGCRMMMAEHDAEQAIIHALEYVYRQGWTLTIGRVSRA